MPKKSYGDALSEALKSFELRDPADAAEKAGAEIDGREIRLRMLGTEYGVDFGGREIHHRPGGEEAKPVQKILLLHYLATASGVPLTDRYVAFREVPGCAFYNTTFHAHTVMALIKGFGNSDSDFQKACEVLGGERTSGSGLSMVLPALPRVPITLTYWAGEEEMPPGAQLLFDASVVDYLPTEDIAVIGETIAHRVLEVAGKGGDAALYQYEA
ncbi:MAG: DUF3786 domain-containing protein [Planctomycetota bacterium]